MAQEIDPELRRRWREIIQEREEQLCRRDDLLDAVEAELHLHRLDGRGWGNGCEDPLRLEDGLANWRDDAWRPSLPTVAMQSRKLLVSAALDTIRTPRGAPVVKDTFLKESYVGTARCLQREGGSGLEVRERSATMAEIASSVGHGDAALLTSAPDAYDLETAAFERELALDRRRLERQSLADAARTRSHPYDTEVALRKVEEELAEDLARLRLASGSGRSGTAVA